MQSIIIIGDGSLSIDKIEEIEFDGFADINRTEEMNLLTIEFVSGRLYLDYSESIIDDYDKEELYKIPIENPKFICVSYSSKKALKKLLNELYIFRNLLIDDDMGNIVDLTAFLGDMF